MQITPIVSDADYQQALSEMRQLAEFEPDRGTAKGLRMDALALVIEAYHPDRPERELEDAESRQSAVRHEEWPRPCSLGHAVAGLMRRGVTCGPGQWPSSAAAPSRPASWDALVGDRASSGRPALSEVPRVPASNIAPPPDTVVAVAPTGMVGSEPRARDMASHADLVVEVAWLAAAVALNARQHEAMLGQLRAEHADALANSVESQWRARDAARAEVGRLNAALAQARAEIERLTANALRLRTQVEGLNASLAEARKLRDPPHP